VRQAVPERRRDFRQCRPAIVEREIGEHNGLRLSFQIASQRQTARPHLLPRRDKIAAAMQPATPARALHGAIAMSDAARQARWPKSVPARAYSIPGPEPAVDVEQRVAALARVVFELDFRNPAIVQTSQKAAGGLLDLVLHDALDRASLRPSCSRPVNLG
jgi:hypothetical protein